jgi:hypothetical protein
MKCLENKYTKWYFSLIEKRKSNVPTGYIELHHITPKSLGGQDENKNLVKLTAREHFICHLLLVKMFPIGSSEYYKMSKAFGCMLWRSGDNQERYKVSNRAYGNLRQEFAESMKLSQSGEGNSSYGKMWICNVNLKQNKKIPKSENIPEGWIKGRVVNWEKTKELKIAEVRTCPCCEKEFEVLEGSPKVYCSGKCRAKVNGKKYRSRKRVEPKKKRVVKTLLQKEVRYCECCGKEFECWESSHKKYCSSSCKNKSSYNSIEKIKISRNGENKIIKPQNYNAYKKIGWKKI